MSKQMRRKLIANLNVTEEKGSFYGSCELRIEMPIVRFRGTKEDLKEKVFKDLDEFLYGNLMEKTKHLYNKVRNNRASLNISIDEDALDIKSHLEELMDIEIRED